MIPSRHKKLAAEFEHPHELAKYVERKLKSLLVRSREKLRQHHMKYGKDDASIYFLRGAIQTCEYLLNDVIPE